MPPAARTSRRASTSSAGVTLLQSISQSPSRAPAVCRGQGRRLQRLQLRPGQRQQRGWTQQLVSSNGRALGQKSAQKKLEYLDITELKNSVMGASFLSGNPHHAPVHLLLFTPGNCRVATTGLRVLAAVDGNTAI
jgi:hypothetical protein